MIDGGMMPTPLHALMGSRLCQSPVFFCSLVFSQVTAVNVCRGATGAITIDHSLQCFYFYCPVVYFLGVIKEPMTGEQHGFFPQSF